MANAQGDRAVTLSRFFDKNVRLVAGVCSRCYLDGDGDVKIVAINRKFLYQVEKRRSLHNSFDGNGASQALDHCQTVPENENLKLSTVTTAADDYPPITPNTSRIRQITPRLNDSNNNSAVGNFPQRTYLSFPQNVSIKVERLSPNLAKLSSDDKKHIVKDEHKIAFKRPQGPLWSPPRSPHNLIEESLFRDPWSLLVATIFLNKTSCKCARPRVEEFLKDFAGPLDVLQRHPSELEKYFLDLGLFKRRAEQVWRMSHDYVHKDWRSAKELYGIGKYGEDAYRIFVLGDLDVDPTDRFLRIYRDWARMKEKDEKANIKIN